MMKSCSPEMKNKDEDFMNKNPTRLIFILKILFNKNQDS